MSPGVKTTHLIFCLSMGYETAASISFVQTLGNCKTDTLWLVPSLFPNFHTIKQQFAVNISISGFGSQLEDVGQQLWAASSMKSPPTLKCFNHLQIRIKNMYGDLHKLCSA
ncbi:hypothetical protein NPIL_324061 [Nephila pilipes]|uniref:Uncharacterized protein n=1 Tax=Nephila pilipes TaxID=299642 RepID=A0A8X6NR86_NEPPI|nr:hypothetical protein NPIL_324061 [Nephila pilipes]